MAWRVEVSDRARRQLLKLGRHEGLRITAFLRERIATDNSPRRVGDALRGDDLAGLWRYRVGDYRLIVAIQDEAVKVLVVSVAHRREAYR